MPLPNFHTCRVKDPSLFKKGSFKTLKTKKKGLTLIAGILKSNNKSTVQSYRYKKQDWTVDRAKKHCSDHAGKFEQASTRKALCLDDVNKDYLKVDEITTELIKNVGLSFLYRTHMKIHDVDITKNNKSDVEYAHKTIVDEMLQRGMFHHQWDKLDIFYQ